jgi:hypothetical protein
LQSTGKNSPFEALIAIAVHRRNSPFEAFVAITGEYSPIAALVAAIVAHGGE